MLKPVHWFHPLVRLLRTMAKVRVSEDSGSTGKHVFALLANAFINYDSGTFE